MSAIACLLRLDGTPAGEAPVRAMLERMSHRGPDGRHVWTDESVGLGHAMLHTTPESLGEGLPLVRGPFALVSDARIDNRDALLQALSGDLNALDLAGDSVADSALVLAAYARWGDAFAEHLIGDFAVVLWDRRRRRLVCARDPLGVRQVYFHHAPGVHLAVASDPAALFAVPGIEPRIDEVRVAESLTGRLYDTLHTVFLGVEKLRPAHLLVATAGQVEQRRYWNLTIGDPPAGDAAEHFREIFDEAVRCRTRSAFPVGAELSGGLDSSSVAVVAAEALRARGAVLHTFSAAFEQATGADERVYIDAVLDQIGDAVPHVFHPEAERFVTLHEEIFRHVADGRVNGNHHFNYLSARAAGQAGARVLLTGQDGDTTVGHGWEWFAEQTLVGGWDAMRAEADLCIDRLAAERGAYDGQIGYTTPGQIVSAYAVPVLRHWAQTKRLGRLVHGAREAHRTFGASYRLLARAVGRDVVRIPAALAGRARAAADAFGQANVPPTIRADVAARTQIAERLAHHEAARADAQRGSFGTAAAQQRMLTSEYLDGSFEKLDLYAAAAGVEARHPFMDVRLVELCLSLPSSEKLQNGYTRSVMRRALASRLPASVAWRANKSHLAAPHDAFVFDSEPERVRDLVDHPGPAADFLNPAGVRQLWERRARLTEWEMGWLTNALAFTIWARTRA